MCTTILLFPTKSYHFPHIPDGFVFLEKVAPNILQNMRYATPHNFVGSVIDGYLAPRCVLSSAAAAALARVAAAAAAQSPSMLLKVYDCYRPQRAVDEFVTWGRNLSAVAMKAEFFPTLNKSDIFPTYVAFMSAHSRGSTMDLTLVRSPPGPDGHYVPGQPLLACTNPLPNRFLDNSIDMGTGFDCFSPLANTANPAVGEEQRANRQLLVKLMADQGFVNDPDEWWHYTLKDEPFPDSYFDFPIPAATKK